MHSMHHSSDDILARFQKLPDFSEAPAPFKGARFTVRSLKVTGDNGKTVQRDVVIHPGAVVILPFLDDDTLILIRNQRFVVGKELWELPAGTLESGEAPIETAKRELIEETGYRAGKIAPLNGFFTTPGFCNEVMYAFVASDLKHVGQSLDDSEHIIVEKVNWNEALEMVRDGRIIDGKTMTTILYYHLFIHADRRQ